MHYKNSLTKEGNLLAAFWIGIAVLALTANPIFVTGAQAQEVICEVDFESETVLDPAVPPNQANVAIGEISYTIPTPIEGYFYSSLAVIGGQNPFLSNSLSIWKDVNISGPGASFSASPDGNQTYSDGVIELEWKAYASQRDAVTGIFTIAGPGGALFEILFDQDGYIYYKDATTATGDLEFPFIFYSTSPLAAGQYEVGIPKFFKVNIDLDNGEYQLYLNQTGSLTLVPVFTTPHHFLPDASGFGAFTLAAVGANPGDGESLSNFGLDDILMTRLNVDSDNDGVPDATDTCKFDFNPGDAQTLNSDGDSIPDACDNCPYVDNEGQEDDDEDGIGNPCESYQMANTLAGISTVIPGAPLWDNICFYNKSANPITLIKPDCANTITRWLGPDGKPAVTRDRHIKAYGIPNDLITIPGDDGDPATDDNKYCINCDIAQTIAPENLNPGTTYEVDHWYSDWLQDRWIATGECYLLGETCYANKWVGWMRTGSFMINVSDNQSVAPLEATASFDPDVWVVQWAGIPGGQPIMAQVSGLTLNGQVPSNIRLNGSVAPISATVENGILKLQFNRRAAVASYQDPPGPGKFFQTIQGQVSSGYFTARAEVLFIEAINVAIDIKPGAYPNSINLGSNGNIPTAIFSSADFDATTVDPETVTLADARVRVVGKKSKLQASLKDVNGDGLTDLFLHIDTTGLQLTNGDVMAYLEGRTYDGESIVGKDTIRIVP